MLLCLLEEEDVGRLEQGQRRATSRAGGTDLLCRGSSPQMWGNLQPPPQTPPSPNCDLALPDWLPKMTLLVLFSNLPRTLWEERKEIKLIR